MQQLKIAKLRSPRILFTKKYQDWKKKLDENTALNDTKITATVIILEGRWKELLSIVQRVPCYGRKPGGIMKEKKTKYFLNLEKRHFKQGTISHLKKSENDFATTDKEILHECESFFEDLYFSKMKTDSLLSETDFFSENDNVLSNEERDSIEGLLTELECSNALKDMEPDKSPGIDGLPSEFYQMFWSEVSKPLIEALNYGFEIGQLSISQKRGIIKLIPKKGEKRQKLDTAFTLKSRLQDSYKSCCKPPEDPSPQTDQQ